MKKMATGIVVGGIIVLSVNLIIDWWGDFDLARKTAAMQTADPSDWIVIQSFVVKGVPPGEVPSAHIRYAVMKPVSVRTEVAPRNLRTGQSICSGRLASLYKEARGPLSFSIPIAALAGLESCVFPVGEYSVSVTITPTDIETNVQLKPIIIERTFSVSGPPAR